ncbi:hypothetical protein DE146DRAFT_786697 [Phaeosphaeria sp. MPI-PUGE-AT-0046c]|nr:hypothetical protein DE146DRAFT_786697 [Phaeosphaeria sp. MPI-PUGE-AT-0046c]
MTRTLSTSTTPPPPISSGTRRSPDIASKRIQQVLKLDTDATTIDPDILEAYRQDILSQSTQCGFNWSDEEDNDSDHEPLTRKAKRPKTCTAAVPSKLAAEPEELNYGDLPLIDIWVAKAKGWTQADVEALPGFSKLKDTSGNGKGSDEKKEEDDDDDDDKVPISYALCDGGAQRSVHICPEELDRMSAMPLPDDNDADLCYGVMPCFQQPSPDEDDWDL